MMFDDDAARAVGAIDDERLRLIFTCCHPALAMEARVALTLRMVGGLTVPEIARAFSCRRPPSDSGSPGPRTRSRRPASPIGCRPRRTSRSVSGVLAVLFLIFNEGYLATGPTSTPYATT